MDGQGFVKRMRRIIEERFALRRGEGSARRGVSLLKRDLIECNWDQVEGDGVPVGDLEDVLGEGLDAVF